MISADAGLIVRAPRPCTDPGAAPVPADCMTESERRGSVFTVSNPVFARPHDSQTTAGAGAAGSGDGLARGPEGAEYVDDRGVRVSDDRLHAAPRLCALAPSMRVLASSIEIQHQCKHRRALRR